MKIKLKKIGAFLKKRAKEKSTYVGLATLAVALGAPEIGIAISKYSDIGLLLLGSGLVAANTTNSEYVPSE